MAYGKGSAPQGSMRPGETLTGMVKSYNRKGFGFIMCQALDADVYFSRESLAPQLQTSDIAGEYVTFEVVRFSDGKFQARNLRPVGDTGITRGPDGFGGAPNKGKGFSKGPSPAGKGFSEEEDRSRDWYCENCNERNFVKRSECFKCKASRPRGADTAELAAPPPPRRTISPHAGSRAMKEELLRKGGGKGGSARSRSTSRRKRRSSSRCGRSRDRSRSRRKRTTSKSSSSAASSRKKRRRSQSGSDSSSSSSDSPSKEAASSSAKQEQSKPQEAANPEVEKAKAEVLQKLLQLQKVEPKEARIKEWRALLREWHPDKNPDRVEVATAVFQFLQKGKLLVDPETKRPE